jgi:hypothetical protein
MLHRITTDEIAAIDGTQPRFSRSCRAEAEQLASEVPA